MADPEPIVAARAAVAAGQRNLARGLLAQIVRADMSNGEAWHLLGQVLDDPAQKAECAERAKAAGYGAESRRIVFPMEEAAEPEPRAVPATPPPMQAQPDEPSELEALRASVTPIEQHRAPEAPGGQPQWRSMALAAVLAVLVIVVVLMFMLG